MAALRDILFRVPQGLPSRQHYRVMMLLYAATLIGTANHVLYLVVFNALHVPFLAFLNIFSVAAWVVAYFCTRWRLFYSAYAIASAEILLHSAACVLVMGLETGFQYLAFIPPTAVFYLPRGRWPFKAALLLATVAVFVATFQIGSIPQLAVQLAPAHNFALYCMNIVAVVGFLAFNGYYLHRLVLATEGDLEIEHSKVERLLHNILPESIARRLRANDGIIADNFGAASVLFADIVGFTPLSQRKTPDELVEILNRIFSRFDDLAERHGLEKIKTIGDAYMVAAGIPESRADHAQAIARFAIDMLAAVAAMQIEGISIRIGIHSGPVVAGVIGKKKFAYDLWGDTVNTASRMESHGEAGKIHVSEAFYTLVHGEHPCVPRGAINVKGKGVMETFFLTAEG